MATKTTNLGLIKPEGTDSPPDITTLNQNWDKLDQELPGKVSKNGDTIEGNLFIQRSAFPQLILRDTTQQRDGFFQYAENGLLFMQNIPLNGNGNDRSLVILGNENSKNEELLRVAKINAGSWQTFRVYHEGHQPTPEQLYASRAVQSHMTIDVGPGKTYTTIQDAINAIPRNLGGWQVTINISAGTHTEDVTIANFYSGQLVIRAADENNKPTITGKVYVGNCSAVIQLQNLNVTDTTGDYCLACDQANKLHLINVTFSGAAKGTGMGLRISAQSNCLMNACTVKLLHTGVMSTYGASVALYDCTMQDCSIGHYASCGIIQISGGINSVDIVHSTDNGGRIYYGSQTAVPNY